VTASPHVLCEGGRRGERERGRGGEETNHSITSHSESPPDQFLDRLAPVFPLGISEREDRGKVNPIASSLADDIISTERRDPSKHSRGRNQPPHSRQKQQSHILGITSMAKLWIVVPPVPAARRSPRVRAPSDCSLLATADANLLSPPATHRRECLSTTARTAAGASTSKAYG
jgi:hypothetical protein